MYAKQIIRPHIQYRLCLYQNYEKVQANNNSKMGQQKQNSKFVNSLIVHPILMQCLESDYLYKLLMGHKKLIFHFVKRPERGSNSEMSDIWSEYLTLKIVKQYKFLK